ncbi:MarR family transcriptional regulator [Paenibacillus sp. 598K]|uniref:MarR family winged helix-turn-helix transcriptional regulator n=1 Tax=Paenibacillus sp. 598K TaxID=1117987 RepID=UPI000FF9C601|nr:MarR family transcriptional regulator [Paenibacillus sp. 598K]GBF75092.1 MarR family transcriptional regulator [Paenibacillus sp. 598K]
MSEGVQELTEAFWRMHRKELDAKAHAATDYKTNETRLLMLLQHRHPQGMKVSELSRAMRVTSPFVTQLLNQMEASELIVRRRDEHDRRMVRIGLTEQGLTAATGVHNFYYGLFVGLADRLGPEDSRKLADLMHRAMDYMDETFSKKE